MMTTAELGYYFGYYAEDSHNMLPELDTQLNIARLNDDYELFFEYAQIMNDYYEKYAKPFKYLRELYQPSIKMARQYAFVHKKRTLKSDEIANGKAIRNFLKEQVLKPNAFATQHKLSHASLYRILNGKRKVIKIQSLKKIVRVLNLDISFENPRDINYILKVMKEESLFEEHSEKIGGMSGSEINQMLLRGIFVSPPFEKTNRIKLLSLREESKKLLDYIKSDYSCKTFINRCFNENFSFYSGRSDLLNKLIEVLGGKIAISRLITRYSTLKSNEEIDLLNRYFRAYAWGKTIKVNFDLKVVLEERFSDPDYEKIICFCEKMNLSELDGYLCTWFFETKERKRLLETIIP